MDSPKNLTKKQKVVESSKFYKREGLWYKADSEKPFTGKSLACWWHTDQKRVEGEWRDGKACGEWIYWHENGQKAQEGEYRDGNRCGKWTYCYENGQKDQEGNYRDGNRCGKWTYYYENGQKEGEWDYCDGKLHGKWTWWHKNGQKDQEGNYRDGNRCGKWTYYYENGQKEAEEEYQNGKLNGKVTYWYKSGKKQVECEYRAGKVHGKTTRWYDSGLKEGEGEFRDGELLNSKCWDENENLIPCPSHSEGTLPPFMTDSDSFTAHNFNRWHKTPMHRRSMKYKYKKREFATKKQILGVLYTLKFARDVGEWHETGIVRRYIDIEGLPSVLGGFTFDKDKIYERILKSLLNTKPPLVETDLPIIENSMPFFPPSMTIKRHIKITNAGIKEVESWTTLKLPGGANGKTLPRVHDSKADAKNVFRKSADYWEIRYQWRKIGPLKDLKGFSYIKVLLNDPSNEYHVLSLSRIFEGYGLPTPNEQYKKMSPEELEEEGLSDKSSPFGGLEVIPPEAMQRMKGRLSELMEDKREYEANNDLINAAKTQEEVEDFKDYISNAYDINGNLRKTGSATERARKSVSAAIQRGLKKIKKHDEKLWSHLDKSLSPISANFLQYTPEEPLDWTTS